jgi:hypothetical protein
MIKEFDLAIVRAESSINDLTKLSKETSAKIHKTTEKAQFLMNDMTFMNDMGSDIASRLEKAIDNAKNLEKKLNLHNYATNAPIKSEEVVNPRHEIETIMARFSSSRNNNEVANKEPNTAYQQLIRQVK